MLYGSIENESYLRIMVEYVPVGKVAVDLIMVGSRTSSERERRHTKHLWGGE